MAALPRKIVLASSNAGKIREFVRLLDGLEIEIIPQSDLGVDDADETGGSFVENSLIKARHASLQTALPAIADDSGLAVTALGGRPGVHSARYAGPAATDDENVDKLLRELAEAKNPSREAAFHCAASFVMPGSDDAIVAEGVWRGEILEARRGQGGFGYDPVFLDPDSGLSGAELSPRQKNERSHRGQALRALVAKLKRSFS